MLCLYTEQLLCIQPERLGKFILVILKLREATFSSSFSYCVLEPGFKVRFD